MSEIEKFLFNTSFDEAALTQDKSNAEAVEEEADKNEAEDNKDCDAQRIKGLWKTAKKCEKANEQD